MQFLFWNLRSVNPKNEREGQQEHTRVNNLCNGLEHLVRNNSVETVMLCDFNIERSVLLKTYVFDQVLLRPDLIEDNREPQIRLIEGYKDQSFVSGYYNTPNAKEWSDHLPLLFDVPIPNIPPLSKA